MSVGVGLLAIVPPLAIGAVHPLTQLALSAIALALFAACLALRNGRGLRLVPFAAAMLLAVGITAVQLVPLPSPIVALLSPGAHALRQEVEPGRFFMPLTVDVPATILALLRAVTCTAVVLVLGTMIRSRGQARRLAALLVAAATIEALIAIGERAAGATQILGFYKPRSLPGFGVFGTFVDVNHAGSLLALGFLVAAGMSFEESRVTRIVARVCTALLGITLLMSTSRGALAGAAIGGFALCVILLARTYGMARGVLAAIVLLTVAVSLSLWTSEGLRARVFMPKGTATWNTQKTRGWVDGLRLTEAYRWTGVGRGAFEAPVNAYRPQNDGVRLVYPENVIVQMTSEWGVPATLALLLALFAAARRFAPSIAKLSATSIGAVCGVVAVVAHEIADFSLETLGVALPTAIALGIALGEAVVEVRKREQRARGPQIAPRLLLGGLAAWIVLLGGSVWASRRTLDADWARFADNRNADTTQLDAAMARHPADDYLALVGAMHALEHGEPHAMRYINRAMQLNPTNWQTHRLAARVLAGANHPTQAALEYRLAIANGFAPSYPELARVLGDAVVDAVPQTPTALFRLARELYSLGQTQLGDAAARRAVEVGDDPEPLLVERLQIAMQLSSPKEIVAAARALAAASSAADSFAQAARALMQAGDYVAAASVVTEGERIHPLDGKLALVDVQVKLGAGRLDDARGALSRAAHLSLSLTERQQAEELLAQIADKQGDGDSAVLARARARLIEQRLRDMSPRTP